MGLEGPAHLLAAWCLAGAFWALIVLGAIDAVWLRLPDGPLVALALCGAVVGTLDPLRGMVAMLAGAAAGGGAFWAIRIGYGALRGREGLGFGDVKLMAALGLLLPLVALPLVVAIGGSLGVLWVLVRPGAGGMRRTTLVPFGTFLCLGAALTLILTWLPGPV